MGFSPIEPGNAALAARAKEAAAQIAAGEFYPDDAAVAAAVGLSGESAAQVFAEVWARTWT